MNRNNEILITLNQDEQRRKSKPEATSRRIMRRPESYIRESGTKMSPHEALKNINAPENGELPPETKRTGEAGILTSGVRREKDPLYLIIAGKQ